MTMKNSSSDSVTVNSLGKLPDEQRQHVLSYLTCHDLMSLTLVSKAVKSAALRSHTLTNIDTGTNASTGKVSAMLRRTIINRQNLDPISSHPRQRRWTVDSSMSPRNLPLSQDLITEQKLINLLERFQFLRVLKLCNLHPTAEAFIPIVNSCPAAASLAHIEFHDVRLIQNSSSLQLPNQNHNLKYVALSGTIFSSYESVLKSFVSSKSLQTLRLDGCRSLTDAHVDDMDRIWSGRPSSTLMHLSLENASKLQTPSIKSTSIKMLDMSKCPALRDLSNIICPNLIEINLCHCPLVNDESIQSLLLACPMIENLILNTCNSLTALRITSRQMKNIDLNLCMKLTSVNINCEILEKLELGFCTKLENLRLDSGLKSLDLSMLPLKDLFLRGLALSELNLSGCTGLKNDSIYMICPNLRTIDISGSNLGSTFEKEYLQRCKKINVLKGGSAHDWMPF
mmetsp:Transcript_23406/g.34817  ORF Transcript_23406/g.34817 Transcript_23406/m.34817 type:complete len:454 (-) Transcript_23406:102-1463(-)